MSEPTYEPAATASDQFLAALADEFAARLRRGERPTVEEYIAKHPQLEEIIRKAFPAIAMIEESRTSDPAASRERLGAMIGRYKLLERIGEGGFGVVYMAEQQHPVRRTLALKVIKPGMDSRQILARFEAERQALAIMDHPNIAKVLDAGATDSGRPYFVMELVKGEPITEYCDRHQLEPRQRLELFVQVCQAVQHAHQKGIIHRDIKPSNVLVSVHDTKPVVKVIDFGVAKALGRELTENTLFTCFAQLLGTPLYMSPEQAGQSALDVDTRSDIYSLGVLLYELLTGTTPFDKQRFKQAAEDEIRRIIREEDPPRPSTRLSESKDSLASISAQRHMEPAKLTKLVRGELDWIVMKTLEKDRTRRYETANGLARDIERHLQDEPVEACPPSASYRLRKFARRNKATLVTAVVIGLALLLAVGSFGWAVRDRSARQAKVAGQVEQILSEVEQLQREQKWPEALAAARRAAAAVAGGRADAAIALRVREQLKNLEFIDRLEQIRMRQLAIIEGKPDYPGTDREYARAFRDYGVDVSELPVELSIERLKSRPAFAIAVAIALDDWMSSPYWDPEPDAPRRKRLVAVARGIDREPVRDQLRATWGKPASEIRDELLRLAGLIDVRAHRPVTLNALAKRLQQADQPFAALRLLRDAQHHYAGDYWLNINLGYLLHIEKDRVGQARFYSAALAIRPTSIAAHNGLARALILQNKFDEAVSVIRRAIEISPNDCTIWNRLGYVLFLRGETAAALAAYRKAMEIDPKYAGTYNNLALLRAECPDLEFRDPGLAVTLSRKSLELEPGNGYFVNTLGVAYYRAGNYKAAITNFERSIEIHKLGGGPPDWLFLAMAHWHLGNRDEARRWYDTSVQEMANRTGPIPHDLNRLRAEAAELLAINATTQPTPSTAAATTQPHPPKN